MMNGNRIQIKRKQFEKSIDNLGAVRRCILAFHRFGYGREVPDMLYFKMSYRDSFKSGKERR